MRGFARKQLLGALFFCALCSSGLRGALPPEESVGLGQQPELVIQCIAYFLPAKDVVHFSHSSRLIHSSLAQELKAIKREYDVTHNVWKFILSQDQAEEAKKDFDAFQAKTKEFIESQKEDHGVEIELYACNLGQGGTSCVLSYLDSVIKNRKCEVVKLDLRSNQLVQIPNEVYKMRYLKELRLTVNPTIVWRSGIFREMPSSLKSLYLDSLKLSQIPEGLFEGLNRVAYLSLYGNHLTELSIKSLRPLESLEVLNLCQNKLRSLELVNGTPMLFPSLKQIDITGNPQEFIARMMQNENWRRASGERIILERKPVS